MLGSSWGRAIEKGNSLQIYFVRRRLMIGTPELPFSAPRRVLDCVATAVLPVRDDWEQEDAAADAGSVLARQEIVRNL